MRNMRENLQNNLRAGANIEAGHNPSKYRKCNIMRQHIYIGIAVLGLSNCMLADHAHIADSDDLHLMTGTAEVADTEQLLVPHISELSGDLNNMGIVHAGADVVTIGSENIMHASKAILTFDTSALPPDADILAIHLGMDILDCQGDCSDGWWQDVQIEVDCPFGTHASLGAADYWDPPLVSTSYRPNAATGMPMLYLAEDDSTAVADAINRDGLTQLRLSWDNRGPSNFTLHAAADAELPALLIVYR